MPAFKDLTGQEFGWLTVLYRDNSKKGTYWILRCICGNYASRSQGTLHNSRKNGALSTCGCFRRTKPPTKHGGFKTPEWQSYSAMIARCYRKHCNGYKNYGGRGITVCERWRHSFENFLTDMGKKPSPDHTLDRIDVEKSYEPSNCKWSSVQEQANNRRQIARGASGYIGVVFHKKHKRWMAAFRKKYLGYFDTPEDAHKRYQQERETYLKALSER